MNKLLDYFHPLSKLKRDRANYLSTHQVPDNIKALLAAPLPDLDDDLFELDYISLDFETTGFEPDTDSLLSVGYLPMINQKLLLNKAVETLIKSVDKIKAETAIINHIVPEMLALGLPLVEVMDELLSVLVGKVIIVHGSMIEKGFLNKYVADNFNLPALPLLWVDTLKIEKSLSVHKSDVGSADYRLSSIRERHGLPEYSSHGALVDALATGELYLALIKKCYEGTDARTRHMTFG
ncbi:MAG: exonuclease domain-containing protein [Psychromonas sp.]